MTPIGDYARHRERFALVVLALVGGLLALNWMLGKSLGQNRILHNLVGPSGHVYGIVYDLASRDGHHYFMAFDASGIDDSTLSAEADELAGMIESDPRSGGLRTIGIEAQRHRGFGLLQFDASAGFIYERRGDRWTTATSNAIGEHLRARGDSPLK